MVRSYDTYAWPQNHGRRWSGSVDDSAANSPDKGFGAARLRGATFTTAVVGGGLLGLELGERRRSEDGHTDGVWTKVS